MQLMRAFGLTILIILIHTVTQGQKRQDKNKPHNIFIIEIFLNLSDIDITKEIKKELLKNSKVSPDGTLVTLSVDSLNNSVFIQSCLKESMTVPCDNYYLQSYANGDRTYKIIYSKSSISYADKYQNELLTYEYRLKEKSLTKDTTRYKALRLTLNDFFKDNTPDSILSKYSEKVHPIYSFSSNKIFCRISDTGFANTLKKEPYLRGNVVEIEWNKNAFLVKKYILEKDETD